MLTAGCIYKLLSNNFCVFNVFIANKEKTDRKRKLLNCSISNSNKMSVVEMS